MSSDATFFRNVISVTCLSFGCLLLNIRHLADIGVSSNRAEPYYSAMLNKDNLPQHLPTVTWSTSHSYATTQTCNYNALYHLVNTKVSTDSVAVVRAL